jgi:hypothetical protein
VQANIVALEGSQMKAGSDRFDWQRRLLAQSRRDAELGSSDVMG